LSVPSKEKRGGELPAREKGEKGKEIDRRCGLLRELNDREYRDWRHLFGREKALREPGKKLCALEERGREATFLVHLKRKKFLTRRGKDPASAETTCDREHVLLLSRILLDARGGKNLS